MTWTSLMGYSMFLSVYFFDVMRHLLWAKQSWLGEFKWILIYCQLYKLLITDLNIEEQVRKPARQALGENSFPPSLPVPAELETRLLPCSPCFWYTWCSVPSVRQWKAEEVGVSPQWFPFFSALCFLLFSSAPASVLPWAAVTLQVYLLRCLLSCILSCLLLYLPFCILPVAVTTLS